MRPRQSLRAPIRSMSNVNLCTEVDSHKIDKGEAVAYCVNTQVVEQWLDQSSLDKGFLVGTLTTSHV